MTTKSKLLLFLLIILCLLLVSTLTVRAEYTGIFSILNEQYIENISDLPYSSGIPDKNIQRSWGNLGWIEGWIDITGFQDMMRDNGTDYVPGNPAQKAIVQNDAWGVFKCSICDYTLTKDTKVYTNGIYTIAYINIKMVWYQLVCTKDGCSCVQHIEFGSFVDSEVSPQVYQPMNKIFVVNLIQYNNSLYENIGIIIPTFNSVGMLNTATKYTKYNGSSVIHTVGQANVEKTPKGVYFANITHVDYWMVLGDNVGQISNITFINGNLSKNINYINIMGSTIYETISANSSYYNISKVEFTPEKEFSNAVLIVFVMTVGILLTAVCFLINRLRVMMYF